MSTSGLSACIARIREHPKAAALAYTYLDEALVSKGPQSRQSDHVPHVKVPGPLLGLVCNVKACVDVKGWTTHAGSAAFLNRSPAQHDAALVAVLRESGAWLLGQTNMTEFAYGALGVNAHFGTPLTPLYPNAGHVAGGSSSGAAVSVAMGFANVALCSDTSGSARIPAAFCGVVGFMPTRGRWPMDGFFPLSPSFDAPGLMTKTVTTCSKVFSVLDAAFAAEPSSVASRLRSSLRQHTGSHESRQPRLCIPINLLDAFPPDAPVVAAFQQAIERLRTEGWHIEQRHIEALDELGTIAADAGMIASDAYAVHRSLMAEFGHAYDPLIRMRIEAGSQHPAWRYAEARHELDRRATCYESETSEFDAVVCPTTPILPPEVSDLARTEDYLALNRRSFAYTEVANRLGKPSISLPLGFNSAKGIGLLLTGKVHRDTELLILPRP